MSMYGESRDISLFMHINRELIDNIIEQKVGYYKIDLPSTKNNMYGESPEKFYRSPVLINCLIERGDNVAVDDDPNKTIIKTITVRFLRQILLEVTIVPEIGDVVLWNNNYFEISNLNENQYVVGKDPSYSYDSDTDNFGSSISIIVTANYVRPERFGIEKQRL